MSPAQLAKLGDQFATNPVCVGPFSFVSRTAGDRIELRKSPVYYDRRSASTSNQLVFRIMTEGTVRGPESPLARRPRRSNACRRPSSAESETTRACCSGRARASATRASRSISPTRTGSASRPCQLDTPLARSAAPAGGVRALARQRGRSTGSGFGGSGDLPAAARSRRSPSRTGAHAVSTCSCARNLARARRLVAPERVPRHRCGSS